MTRTQKALDSLLVRLWNLVSARPKTVIVCGLLLALAAGLASAAFLRLNSEQDALVSPDVPHHRKYLESIENFGDQEYIFTVIRTGGTEEGKRKAASFAEDMAAQLAKRPDLIREVHYKMAPADLGPGALLFASRDEARQLASMVETLAPAANAWAADPTLAEFLDQLAGLLSQNLSGQAGTDSAELMFTKGIGALSDLAGDMRNALDGAPSATFSLDPAHGQGEYFYTRNGKLLIMRILPVKDFTSLGVVTEPLKAVRDALEKARELNPDVEAGLTGRPVLSSDEMDTTDKDMTRAGILSVLAVGLLFMLVMHGWLRPLLVMVSLCSAIAWTFGFALLAIGELNLLSIVFALVLVGIGVDFGIHIAMRHMEGCKQGLSPAEAVREAMLSTGPGITLGAVTSVCAFFVVLGSDFKGLAELGLIGGAGILLCLLSMLTLLPALLLVAGRNNLLPYSHPRITALPFMTALTKRPARLLITLLVLSIAAIPGLYRTGFSYNLLELQAEGLDSIHWEHVLMDESDESTWFGILAARDLDEVRDLTARLGERPEVAKVESILDFIPKDQDAKAAMYARAAEALRLPDPPPPAAPVDPARLERALDRLVRGLENLEEKLFSAGAGDELQAVESLLDKLDGIREQIAARPEEASRLNALQDRMRRELSATLSWLDESLSTDAVDTASLPPSIRGLYVGKDGRFQVKVIPKDNVWDYDKLTVFVHALREIDPDASGVPVGVYESSRLMHDTFLSAAGWTLALVALILWLSSRSIRSVILTMLPLCAGILWLLEAMGWFGLNFNLANFFAIPVLIAIGVDGGVHLLARWQELALGASPTAMEGCLFHTSTPTAVILSFLTTMIGFGGLLLAHHKGLGSLGAIMVLGSLTCMLGCILVLPAVLMRLNRASKGE